jgi:hypothetical protein
MKAQPSPQAVAGRSTNHVCALLIVLCILCGTLAVVFYRQSSERKDLLDKLQRKQSHRAETGQTGGAADGDASARGSEQVFKQVDLLAQKDAVINELRQRILALQEGRTPDAGLSPNALPRVVRSSRQHKTPERPPVAPSPSPIRPAPSAPPPVFKTLAVQKEFLQNLETDSMTAGEQENHAELLRQIESHNRLVAQLENSPGKEASDRIRPALLRQDKIIEVLMQQERLALFCSVGRSLGYNDDSSLVLARYIEQVERMTSVEQSAAPDDASPQSSGQ